MAGRVVTLLAAVTLSLLGPGVNAATAQAPTPVARACAGVLVVVDGGATGGAASAGCATSFDTGTQALRSAGHTLRQRNGLICAIDGKPDSCAVTAQAYWSYWHATRNPDGSFSGWTYSTLGADSYAPQRGDAEGWAFGSGSPPALAPDGTTATAATTSAAPLPSAAPAPSDPTPADPAPDPGSPTGVLVTLGIVAVGALAIGGWRWLKRRG